jgi:hypothetical protein
MINIYTKKTIQEKHLAIQKWRSLIELPKTQSQIEDIQNRELDLLKQKNGQREKELGEKENGCKQKET